MIYLLVERRQCGLYGNPSNLDVGRLQKISVKSAKLLERVRCQSHLTCGGVVEWRYVRGERLMKILTLELVRVIVGWNYRLTESVSSDPEM